MTRAEIEEAAAHSRNKLNRACQALRTAVADALKVADEVERLLIEREREAVR
ncbi:MAG: hypothetical protein AB7O60_03300 [Variibacter sp.]